MHTERERQVADHVAACVRELRKSKGWTQKHLAEVAGIDQSTISRIESGKRLENLHSLVMVAVALGTTLHEILPPVR